MMRVIQFSMPGRLLLEYGVFQVPLKNTTTGYDKDIIKIKYSHEAMQILIIS